MLSTTLKDYKGTYKAKLNAFLADYEDNSEKYFFQLESAEYLEYYNSLISISELIKEQLNQNAKEIVINSFKANELQRINSLAYSSIMTRKIIKVYDSGPPEFLLEGMIPSKVIVHSGKLENHISSANAIMEFIDEQINRTSKNINAEKPISPPKSLTQTNNFFPRIFTNEKAYEVFEKLRGEFEGKKNTLANFSFVFHRMKKDGLIFEHLKQLEFVNFLSELNINIDRIKPKSQMGNEDFRESIYNRLKSS